MSCAGCPAASIVPENTDNPHGDSALKSTGNKVAYAVIGAFVAVCAIGWAIIVAHAEGTPGIDTEIISWQASDHSMDVRFQIGKPKDRLVRCAVIAYDTGHGIVGRTEVAIPAGSSAVTERQDVPTSSRATAVDVRDCRKVG
jgi:hypothetical protein